MTANIETTKESFQIELARLARLFASHEPEYGSASYPERQVRTDFLSPLFRALGWDVENRAGLSYSQREVIEEKGPTEGRPDYNFRIGGITRFFVEAKAPHENLDSERHVLQAKRYAWSTKEVFAVILTDFDEFRFYDASLEPDSRDPHRGLLLHLRYNEYLENIEKLWEFSRERVAAGSIEAMLPAEKRILRFRKPVDQKFLEDVTRWREELAIAVHQRNPGIGVRELTEIVQRLLDRFIFIRVAEDRQILPNRSLWERVQDWKAMGGRKPLLPMLNDLFHQINEDWDSGHILDIRTHPIDYEKSMLHFMNDVYDIGVQMVIDIMGSLARGESLRAVEQDTSRSRYYTFPTQEELEDYRRCNISLVDPAAIVSVIVDSYSPPHEKSGLRSMLEKVIEAWYHAEGVFQSQQETKLKTFMPPQADGKWDMGFMTNAIRVNADSATVR